MATAASRVGAGVARSDPGSTQRSPPVADARVDAAGELRRVRRRCDAAIHASLPASRLRRRRGSKNASRSMKPVTPRSTARTGMPARGRLVDDRGRRRPARCSASTSASAEQLGSPRPAIDRVVQLDALDPSAERVDGACSQLARVRRRASSFGALPVHVEAQVDAPLGGLVAAARTIVPTPFAGRVAADHDAPAAGLAARSLRPRRKFGRRRSPARR